MNTFKNVFLTVFIAYICAIDNLCLSQCDPATIDLCEIGSNSIIQACYHAQIIKTSNGYSITGQDLTPNGTNQVVLSNIPSPAYNMPFGVFPVWGAIGGRTQAVFLASDNNIYAVGEEDLLINTTNTSSSHWGMTSLKLPAGIEVCDVNKWEGTAGSGNDNNGIATGDRDGFLVFSTFSGELYITGDGASAIQDQAANDIWTKINLPNDIFVINFAVGYRTLLIEGSDGNLYASGPDSYMGDGTKVNLDKVTKLITQPNLSVYGILQIEAGFNYYLVLDGDGTIHVLGDNPEAALGVGHSNDVTTWSKVGNGCPEGILKNVAYISTMSTHDYRIASSAILVDATVRSWGSNSKQSITSGEDRLITCPIRPNGHNANAIAISNGGHISPYVNTNIQICNIGHNKDGAFGDGNDEEGDYGEYKCNFIPGNPEVCGTKEVDLELQKSVSDENPRTGEDIVFAIRLINQGPDASTGSLVRDELSEAFYYISDDSGGDYNPTTGLWKVGPLENGESKTLQITVKVLLAGSQSNYAQVLADNQIDRDSTPGDNSTDQDDDDTVHLEVIPCPVSTEDIILCPNDSLLIGDLWIYQSGVYLVTIPINIECDSLHIATVKYVEDPPMPQWEVDCEEFEFVLSVDPSSSWHPFWDNGDTAYQTIYDNTQHQATLTLENDPNCLEQFVVHLPPMANIDELPFIQDTIIKENDLLELQIDLNTEEWQVQWSPESIMDCNTCMYVNISAKESTTVSMYFEHISGCRYESSFFLDVEKIPEVITTANIFSPNGDSSNDEWTIFNSSNILIEECRIYDRWGSMVFSSIDTHPKWDGRHQGVACSQGVYVYSITYLDSEGINQVKAGNLTLIR